MKILLFVEGGKPDPNSHDIMIYLNLFKPFKLENGICIGIMHLKKQIYTLKYDNNR